MKEQFVPYDLALKLKELGFDEECFYIWEYNNMIPMMEELSIEKPDLEIDTSLMPKFVLRNSHSGFFEPLINKEDSCLAPLWQQAFDWLLEKTDYSTVPVMTKTLDGKYHTSGKKHDSVFLAKTTEVERLIELLEEQNGKT